MKIETLVVTVDQHDFSLLEKMNLQTDAVVGNQAECFAEQTFLRNGCRITWCTRAERGVGRNRNLVLEKAEGELCVFADDDLRFVDGYPAMVEQAFRESGQADILVFNLIEAQPTRFVNRKMHRVHRWNYARYGAARLVVRRDSLEKAGIRFSLLFGGGAEYGCGEDTIFLHQCLKKKLKIVAVPYALAEIDPNAVSTWFAGYEPQFFMDKGALYAALYPHAAVFFCVRYLVKYRYRYCRTISTRNAFFQMLMGVRAFRRKFPKGEQPCADSAQQQRWKA